MSKVNKIIPITFNKIKDYSVEDTRFTRVSIRMMHLGLNLNNSIFTKEVVDEAIPTLYNTPILAYVEKNSDGVDDFSDHRQELSIEDGDIKVTYKCIPFGVIGESCNPRYEKHTAEDGIERTYLVVDGLVWNKLEHSEIFSRDVIKDASMELSEKYSGSFNEDNHFVFTKIEFNGICGLGNNVEPAMVGSNIEVNFALNEIKTKLEQFNTYFNNQSPNGVDDIKDFKKGGNLVLETKLINSILKEFNVNKEDLDFEITDGMTEKEFRDALDLFTKKNDSNILSDEKIDAILAEYSVSKDELGELNPDVTEDDFKTLVSEFAKAREAKKPEVAFSTYNEKRELLRGILQRKEQRDEDGDLEHYLGFWIADFDDSYVYVEKEEYDGDSWSYEKGRFAYAISNNVASITSEFELMIVKWLTAEEYAEIEKMRTSYELNEKNQKEFTRLQEFEKTTLDNQRDSDIKALFKKFDEKLSDIKEYKTLKESSSEMSLEDIEMKCFAIVGKVTTNFSTEKKSGVVKLDFEVSEKDTEADDGYGGILASKYNK